jgi:hypothetical protein
MVVEDLIEELKKMPPKADVMYDAGQGLVFIEGVYSSKHLRATGNDCFRRETEVDVVEVGWWFPTK